MPTRETGSGDGRRPAAAERGLNPTHPTVEAKPGSSVGGQAASSPRRFASILSHVSRDHVRETVDVLAAFGTRHTLSPDTDPGRGNAAARRWIKRTLESFAALPGSRLSVIEEEFDAEPSTRLPLGARIVNLLAIIPGVDPEASRRATYVMAHYDSMTADPLDSTSDAPGADDNASGCALAIEAARVLCTAPLSGTVVIVLTGGEEQGLLGAAFRASAAAASRSLHVHAVLNCDIVGDPSGPAGSIHPARRDVVRVFSEGVPMAADDASRTMFRSNGLESDSPSRELARFIVDVARLEMTDVAPMLVFRPDRFRRGGDHTPFVTRGIPAVRFTEPDEHFSRQHARVDRSIERGDLPQFVDAEYLAGVTRLNVAALCHLASAPPAPDRVRAGHSPTGSGTLVRWTPIASGARHEVVCRLTTDAMWRWVFPADGDDFAMVDLCLDDHIFGVRAVSTEGVAGVPRVAIPSTE
ncbi:MAG: M20/M25/M40 family metallo-hydrolase [Phycisphaerales bacterium]|nr:MAG: M20/M25/M40 family metallo-hydrolase [Phycisphaerales bacterium]